LVAIASSSILREDVEILTGILGVIETCQLPLASAVPVPSPNCVDIPEIGTATMSVAVTVTFIPCPAVPLTTIGDPTVAPLFGAVLTGVAGGPTWIVGRFGVLGNCGSCGTCTF